MDNAAVTTHYNERRDEGRRGRMESRIIRMRSFNNWVKSVLINLHTRPGARVLDLCCGKGGDLNKWAKVQISEYVACDTAPVSVQQAAERYNSMDNVTFRPQLLVGDCFDARLADYFSDETVFDVVSCQFAVHYAFENESRVRRMLLNVTERLRPGGFFIGTTTDANVLVRKLRAVDGLAISNGVFRIDLDPRFGEKKFSNGPNSQYGIRYVFTLDQNIEDCPEYLVHFPLLQTLALEYDLELVFLKNFHDFYTEFNSDLYGDFQGLCARMGVQDGGMSLDEWDAIYLYTAFAFKKRGNASEGLPSTDAMKRRKWDAVDPSEIVTMTRRPEDTDAAHVVPEAETVQEPDPDVDA